MNLGQVTSTADEIHIKGKIASPGRKHYSAIVFLIIILSKTMSDILFKIASLPRFKLFIMYFVLQDFFDFSLI